MQLEVYGPLTLQKDFKTTYILMKKDNKTSERIHIKMLATAISGW